ncbi:hypothetical protein [Sulfurisoma sediminicola]|uniref:hypothetical protein n=1 Tax=Sulfurisoma sediminicola TaxID=1381557 RepID=UPI000EB316B1|nr:hypothetical protein [Sulfurisoma sediminicola]
MFVADLATNPYFTTHDFRAVPQRYRTLVPEYGKDRRHRYQTPHPPGAVSATPIGVLHLSMC